MANPSSTIKLRLVKHEHIKQILSCWTESIEFRRNEIDNLVPDDNPLKGVIANNIAPNPFRSILSSAVTHYKASVLLEEPYLDVECWDSYSSFYSATFSKFERESRRLHFFSCNNEIAEKIVVELLGGATENELSVSKDKYKGYCVLRALPTFNIGRSAIVFDDTPPRFTRNKSSSSPTRKDRTSSPNSCTLLSSQNFKCTFWFSSPRIHSARP